jgi:hypothetical protein
MSAELVRTDDKKIALAVLERYLDSADLVNARMQYLDGMCAGIPPSAGGKHHLFEQ